MKKEQSSEASHIGVVLSRLVAQLRPEVREGMLAVWQVWERAVGVEIARNARPAAFKGSLLLVHVTNSAWLHHLHFLKKDLLLRINTELGKPLVTEIKFKIGSF
jgi:predicted nucleic acid-binding Zn ribbon protein